MAVHASRHIGFGAGVLRAGALAFAGLCAACGSLDPGYSIVMQDKYDFMTCPEIVAQRAGLVNREKELTALVEKADASPGGIMVSVAVYRSELVSARTQLRVATRAAQEKGCDAAKPK